MKAVKKTEGILETVVYTGSELQTSKPILWNKNLHMTIGDGDTETPYFEGSNMRNACKYGQLKLLVSEINFFNRYWDPNKIPEPICIYVGAADGMHIKALYELYPQFEYHLYDKRPFSNLLNNIDKIHLHNQYFDNDELQKYKSLAHRIFFMSDIRSLSYDNDTRGYKAMMDNENSVYKDMMMQQEWVLNLRPYKSMLKFRLPYKNDYTKTLYPNLKMKYLSGICWLQPWRASTSSELRLIPNDDLEQQDWNFEKVENIMFEQNRVRNDQKFLNPINDQATEIFPDIGIVNDWDSVFTLQIAIDYLNKYNVLPNTDKIKKLLKYICDNANPPNTLYLHRVGGSSSLNNEDD